MRPGPQHPLRAALSSWAQAVRDSYVALLPLTFLGVLATLVQHLPVPGQGVPLAALLGPSVARAVDDLMAATQGIFGLALACVLAVQIGRQQRRPGAWAPAPLWQAMAALVNFVIWVVAQGSMHKGGMGIQSMLLGIVVGSYSPWLMALMARMAPHLLRSHGETDLVFLNATRASLPLVFCAMLTLLAATLGQTLFDGAAGALGAQLPSPQSLTDSGTLLTLLAVLANQIPWAVGIHGGQVVEFSVSGVFAPPGAEFDSTRAWRPLINTFVHLGGAGAMLGLALALLLAVRSGPQRRLAHASLLPSVFNVNELLIFGLPVVLHPRYLVPFIGVPVLLALSSLALIHAGLLPVRPQDIHWTTPVLLSGWQLTGSWVGVAWQAVGVAISTACYLPVVRHVEADRLKASREAVTQVGQTILAARDQQRQVVRESSQAGAIARVLLADLEHDLHTPSVHLVYQPKHYRDGRVSGVEALLRWSHSQFGPIRTDVAIALAEDGGLVRALGLRVLDLACACKADWNADGVQDITMAVNVSPLQLSEPGFAAAVTAALQRNGLAPNEVELEITESQAIAHDEVLSANMAELKALGVRIAMDDFGMGHTSLVHLRRFEIHAIKIDGSLTRDVLTQRASADIVGSIAALARARGLQVVAEFVETLAQRDRLAELGCTVFQGYLHAPPLPAAECLAHMRKAGAGQGEAPAEAEALPARRSALMPIAATERPAARARP